MSTATIPVSAPALMTVEEFLRLHGDEPGVELVRGRVLRLPMSGVDHGEVCFEAASIIREFIKPRGLGRVMTNDSMIPTGEHSARGADVCFFSYKRLPKDIRTPRVVDVPPELVIEVRSPTDRMKAVMEKIQEYLDAGVDVVVLLDPAVESATVFRKDAEQQLTNRDELTLPDILPEFSVPVRKFFE
jgi:Uma2 family endonuclease